MNLNLSIGYLRFENEKFDDGTRVERLLAENWVTGALALAFLGYVAARAWLLPITHDEGATILNHVPRLVEDTLFFQKEANPNNHILNTLGIKLFLSIFLGSQFVVRLPVLIGCALYLWASMGICHRLSPQNWVRVFGMIVLIGNPFLAEFFGLARGYGLASGLMLMALYQAWRFFENNTARTLCTAFIYAGLAVYANFTLLLFFAPFTILLFCAGWQQNRRWAAFRTVALPALCTVVIFTLLWLTPLRHLSKDQELVHWEQLGSDFETIRLLVRSSTHGQPYLGADTTLILSWAALAAMLAGWSIAVWQWRRQNWRFAQDPKTFLAAVFAGAVIANLMNVHLLHTAQLNARLSLFFYPLFALLLGSMAAWIWQRARKFTWILLAPVLVLTLMNNVRCMNLHASFEWWFDSSTFAVLNKMQEIQAAEGRTEPYTFDGHWAMMNSFTVHVSEFPQGYDRTVQSVSWHADRVPTPGPDFFFALNEVELQALRETYQVVYRPPVGVLLRKK